MPKNSKDNVKRRRTRILEMLAQTGSLKIDAIAEALHISSMTVRRDLDYLEEQHFVWIASGGAVSLRENTAIDSDIAKREGQNREEKTAMARAALEYVEEGDVIGLDASTSALELARMLISKKNITIVTNNLQIPPMFSANEDIRVISAGGLLRARALSTVGGIACHTINQFLYDKLFFSSNAVDCEVGMSDTELHEIQTKIAFIQNASTKIALMDHSKIGKRAFQKCCPPDQIDVMITDCKTSKKAIEGFEKAGIRVVRAGGR